jgi:hypothetical protein
VQIVARQDADAVSRHWLAGESLSWGSTPISVLAAAIAWLA